MSVKWVGTDFYANDATGFTVRAWESFDDWLWAVVPDNTVHAAVSGCAASEANAKRAAEAALAKLVKGGRR